ncbi:hypothetical protein NEISICOT_03532 [Neisseria sicca ATCC 29256]|uniref:Uncharacterized protein n=1 Tax=Neisseria sicca ATCC 29256 TaxID=547045 RepID=C6MAF0_NEISI|nr:hypothetical protein NEISICOT_03532 [Neisseria sicca ATCC 29256]
MRSSEKRTGKIKGRLKPCDYGFQTTFLTFMVDERELKINKKLPH